MPRYEVRDADTYGHAIGILLLDYRGPFIPGDVGNATTYGYPVLYKLVKGLTLDRVLAGDPTCAGPIVEAAKELEQFGVRGISSDCGFLIQYQAAVQAAVGVPVFMSSMLQIPFLAQALGGRTVGCLTANGQRLTEQVLGLASVAPGMRVAIRGMETEPHFREAILEECGFLDSDRLEEECVRAARQLQAEEPDLGGEHCENIRNTSGEDRVFGGGFLALLQLLDHVSVGRASSSVSALPGLRRRRSSGPR